MTCFFSLFTMWRHISNWTFVMWRKFSTWQSVTWKKFLHMTNFFSTSTACGACDKYQVCLKVPWNMIWGVTSSQERGFLEKMIWEVTSSQERGFLDKWYERYYLKPREDGPAGDERPRQAGEAGEVRGEKLPNWLLKTNKSRSVFE